MKASGWLGGISLGLVLLMSSTVAVCQSKERPKPPADDWKGTNFITAPSASVSASGDPFDPSVHASMTPSGELCSNELNAAIYRQDILHAFESDAHFDNCAIDEAMRYFTALVQKGSDSIGKVPASAGTGRPPSQILEAMQAFGQALHIIQDFYAHTNYVELVQKQLPLLTDESEIPIVEFWTPAGRDHVRSQASGGLISGRVWWSLPHACASNGATHADLAKDSPSTTAGAKRSILQNRITGQQLSNFTVAYNLAGRATREYLRWIGHTHPEIEKYCGKTLKYIVQADRRQTE